MTTIYDDILKKLTQSSNLTFTRRVAITLATSVLGTLTGTTTKTNPLLKLTDLHDVPSRPYSAADLFRVWSLDLTRREQAETLVLLLISATTLIKAALGEVTPDRVVTLFHTRFGDLIQQRYQGLGQFGPDGAGGFAPITMPDVPDVETTAALPETLASVLALFIDFDTTYLDPRGRALLDRLLAQNPFLPGAQRDKKTTTPGPQPPIVQDLTDSFDIACDAPSSLIHVTIVEDVSTLAQFDGDAVFAAFGFTQHTGQTPTDAYSYVLLEPFIVDNSSTQGWVARGYITAGETLHATGRYWIRDSAGQTSRAAAFAFTFHC